MRTRRLMNHNRGLFTKLFVAAMGIATSVAFATPPNDDCATPAPVSGAGAWSLDDLLTATQSPNPLPGTTKDVWFCWTPTWSGTGTVGGARINFGAGSNLSAAIYAGCGCPASTTAPIATVSPFNGLPMFVDIPVECGQQYMIRVAAEGPLYPSQDVRSFRISKLAESADCPEPAPTTCPDCCGSKPSFDDAVWRNNYGGQVAVMTASYEGAVQQPVVTIFNLGHPAPLPSPVMSAGWDPVPTTLTTATPATAFRYSNRNWFKDRIGSVFGLTLDNQGNIYTSFFGMYSELVYAGTCGITPMDTPANPVAMIGTHPGSSSTSIFKLAIGTGNVTTMNLPGGSTNRDDPGLGNLNFDCTYNQMFVSHLGDGRIYRISPAGTILSAYDHAADRYDNAAAAAALEPGAPYTSMVRPGERVWAVQRFKNRLYYSVWGQSMNDWCGNGASTTPNTIWSIGINASGDFIAGSRQFELQLPVHPGVTSPPEAPASSIFASPLSQYSNPVSDISFSSDCKMLTAERSMTQDGLTLAHASRAMEWQWNGSAWIPVNYRGSLGYQVGNSDPSGGVIGTNASGGCDYDATPAGPDGKGGRLWLTGDALVPFLPNTGVYGLTGLIRTNAFGSTNLTSIMVDYDAVIGGDLSQVKSTLGDIEIPCAKGCATINDVRILCKLTGQPPTPNGTYNYTFTFTNNSGQPIQFLFFGNGSGVTPGSIALPTPVPNGQTSPPITVTLSGGTPGQPKCFFITFANPNIEQCCRIEHCVTLPECDCAQILDCATQCDPASGTVNLTFTLQNLFGGIINELHIFPLPIGGPTTVTPADFFFPDVPQGGTITLSTTVAGGSGTQCFRISTHHDGMDCCSIVKCVDLPNCSIGTSCNDIDFNNDGSVFDPQDIDAFLSVYSEGPCIPGTATCDSIDFNNDGSIFDPCDIDSFLTVFSEGPCLPCGQ
ncbi:MAG: hypothetical protein U0640_12350 [Phycisphaerales bacterium]